MSLTLLPLWYYGRRVAKALVDAPLGDLPASVRWTLSPPEVWRASLVYRPDVMLASFAEDTELLKKCHPHAMLVAGSSRLNLRLSRVALRPQVVPLIQRFSLEIHPPSKEATLHEILTLTSPIARVIFLNRNRVDLRIENLREITREPSLGAGSETF